MEFAFDSQQRLIGIVPNEETAAEQAFTYDGASRLKTATVGDFAAEYVYTGASSRLERTEFRHDNVQTGRSDWTYDPKGRLSEITTRQQSSSKPLSSHAYSYNVLNQRTQASLENGARWNFAYDDLGQVTEGKKRNAAGNLVPGRQFEYTFDTIGNRMETKANGRTATYAANTLNQYTGRQVPGAIDVSGEADPAAVVTVEGLPAARQLEYFYKEIGVSNGGAPVYEEIRTVAARDGLTNEKIGFEYVPQTPETFTYDDDGNLLSDGRFTYTWDAENRLIALESISGAPELSKWKAIYSYDPLGKRISKKVWEWDDLTSGYVVKEELRFLYSGWNLVAEINAGGGMVRSHLWGLDLSGLMQGAGGVGGLLCTTSYGLETEQWFPAYDGNGNVMAMVNTETGETQAQFEYDPFGREVRATGPALAHAKFRFSSKYLDGESGLSYYGYRFYNPGAGRWINRDPIGERGGRNLYIFIQNTPIINIDALGLEPGFFEPELIIGMVSQRQLNEFYGLIDSINSVKSKSGTQCYSIYVHIDPVSSSVIKKLVQMDLTDKVIIFAHGSPDGKIRLIDGQFKVTDLSRDVKDAGKSCTYMACYISPFKGRVSQSGMLQTQIEELKRIKSQLSPQPECCTPIRIQYLTGPR